jgi:hypothetical protein
MDKLLELFNLPIIMKYVEETALDNTGMAWILSDTRNAKKSRGFSMNLLQGRQKWINPGSTIVRTCPTLKSALRKVVACILVLLYLHSIEKEML